MQSLHSHAGQAVKLLKSAYGLASAPCDWHLDVKHVLVNVCHLKQLRSDPCMFICQEPEKLDGAQEALGVIAVHVDDFILGGATGNPIWDRALARFRAAFQWSPWEASPFVHCGVELSQQPDFSFQLDHASCCTALKQVGTISEKPL